MPRIKDLTNYTGALNRADIFFAVDSNSFSRGMSLSGQQVFTMCKGIDGKNIELRNNSTHIQWRWAGDSTWANLIAASSLKGEDGKELEIRVQSGYIQTRLTGGTWASLIALDDLKGEKGDPSDDPNLTFTVSALAPDATPTAEVVGVYPNLTVALGLPKGKDAANPNLAFVISALEWNETPTANVTGTYPDLTVNLGIPKGKDAANPNFTVNAIKGNPGENPEAVISGAYPNLELAFKIPEGEPAANPNLTFTVSVLAPDATPTAEVIGIYPNLTVALGLPKGKDAANPNLAFVISALEWNETPTANVTGAYPDLTINLGIPKGKDAANPNFAVNAIKGNPGENPEAVISGAYPNLELAFKIPEGLRGLQGKPLIVLANGNYGNWDEVTEQYDDSGVQATATVDIENIPVVFTEAATRETINSEETVPAVFGKLKKWFSDFGTLAWKDKADYSTDIDNLPAIPESQIQSDWSQTDTTKYDFIKSKPDLAIYAEKTELPDLTPYATTNMLFKHAFVTQAQYDALGSNVLTDGVTYFISEATSRTILAKNNYPSTDCFFILSKNIPYYTQLSDYGSSIGALSDMAVSAYFDKDGLMKPLYEDTASIRACYVGMGGGAVLWSWLQDGVTEYSFGS